MMRKTHDLAMQTQDQGHTSKSWGLPLNFCVRSISPQPFVRFTLNPNVSFSKMLCRTHHSARQTQGQGLSSRACVLPLNFESAQMSPEPFYRFSLNFGQC